VAVAAGLVVLVVLGVVSLLTVTNGVDTPPATNPLPATSVTSPPPTTIPDEDVAPPTTIIVEEVPPPTPAVVESVEDWLALPLESLGEPGTYRTNEFDAGFSFTVPNGWSMELDQSKGDDQIGLVWLIPATGEHDSEHIWFVISAEKSVDAVVDRWLDAAQVREDREIETVPPVDVVIGGAHGKTLQMEQTVFQRNPPTVGWALDRDQHHFEDLGLPDLFDRSLDFGQPTFVHVVSVGDETVIIWVQTGEFVAQPGVIRSEFFDTAQTVLDTIVWRDLLR
jgi:hypothetical protein